MLFTLIKGIIKHVVLYKFDKEKFHKLVGEEIGFLIIIILTLIIGVGGYNIYGFAHVTLADEVRGMIVESSSTNEYGEALVEISDCQGLIDEKKEVMDDVRNHGYQSRGTFYRYFLEYKLIDTEGVKYGFFRDPLGDSGFKKLSEENHFVISNFNIPENLDYVPDLHTNMLVVPPSHKAVLSCKSEEGKVLQILVIDNRKSREDNLFIQNTYYID